MRILFTPVPVPGHVYPLVPLAEAARAAGHTVAFAHFPTLGAHHVGQELEAAGFAFVPLAATAAAGLLDTDAVRALRAQANGDPLVAREHARARLFPDLLPRLVLPDLVALCTRWRPDVIVADNYEFAGRVAAERLGIAHATLKVGEVYPYAERHRLVREMDALRACVGMRPDPDGGMLPHHLYLLNEPPSLGDPNDLLPPATCRYRRPVFDDVASATLPRWLDNLPPGPVVYATAGTIHNKVPGVLEAMIAGLRDEPITLIAAVGRDRDPAEFGRLPANVRIEQYVPQSRAFPVCDVVVSHAGAGTIYAALDHGLPLINIPVGADQPENAARCVRAGVGITVAAPERTPVAIREALRRVLAEPRYRATAQRLRAELHALPGPEVAVCALENLVHARRSARLRT